MEDLQVENKYYAAKAILRLVNSFTVKRFNGIDPVKYKEYLQELEEEK